MARSSGKPAPFQPMLFDQTLIDEFIDNIEARVVHEKDLEPTHLQWLLGPDGNSPRSVGISPAYSQSGSLPALAFALDTRVLVINFHKSMPYRDGATASGTVPRNVERRGLLEYELLCHPLCKLYGFDLANIALSLHLHLHLRLTDAVDIQSALRISDRSVVSSVETVIADAFKVWSENIDRAFENMIYQSSKHKDLTDLVQRAWLCSYIGRYDVEAIKDMFYKAPKIDTAKFSQDELNVLQKVTYDMLRKDNMKPQTVKHEVKTRWDPRKEKMVAVSQRYANRITQNSTRVKVTLAHGSDASYSLQGGASNVRGKNAGLDVEHNLEGKRITLITTTGRDGPTPAELDCANAILSMLQGTLPLLDDHWMKAIWRPSEPVVWPFTPPPDSPATEIITHPNAPLNTSQRLAITKMLSSSLDDNITLIQGPPGTGKTTTIATYVLSVIKAGQRGIWLMAQSNVAVKNIAEKLAKVEFFDFKLLVSQGFHFEWHEHLYEKIKENIIISDQFSKQGRIQKALQGTRVILCTLSMISNPKLAGITQLVPVVNVIIDEASQIEVGQYVPLFKTFGKSLRKMCFVGDDKQLPPHGQDDLQNLQSIFEVEHLRKSLTFLDTQYRMPPQIGDFISQRVYDGQLLSYEGHVVPSSTIACRFIDVNGTERLDNDGKSTYNQEEVDAIVLLAQHLQDENISFRIITPYDAQRNALEHALQEEDLKWKDKCFNVDSFQGNEDHVIIISVVRTKGLGFLTNMRRTNVMLTRCQHAMYIVSSRAFLEGKGADSLVGKMAAELGQRPGAWLTDEDLENGKFE